MTVLGPGWRIITGYSGCAASLSNADAERLMENWAQRPPSLFEMSAIMMTTLVCYHKP